MANASYCRFNNTANDLQDCVDNWELDEDANDFEIRAKKQVIELAKEIVEMSEDSEDE